MVESSACWSDWDKENMGRGQAGVHPISCQCGKVRGELQISRAANRGVCYCGDCRTYAQLLGKTAEVLDSLGGTDVIATLPENIRFTTGQEYLACLSLSPRGALRWYAGCCNTAIANTSRDYKIPYASVVHSCLEHAGVDLDAAFGPVRMRVNTQTVRGRVATMPVSTLIAVAKLLSWLIAARFNGAYRRTPFFAADAVPSVAVRVITPAERNRARRAALQRQAG
jgi:hypothetical protein